MAETISSYVSSPGLASNPVGLLIAILEARVTAFKDPLTTTFAVINYTYNPESGQWRVVVCRGLKIG